MTNEITAVWIAESELCGISNFIYWKSSKNCDKANCIEMLLFDDINCYFLQY